MGTELEVDVVVVGSGAAGLTAATLASDGGANVLLIEKAPLIGGTTGVSGGMPWIPMNAHMDEIGIADDRDEALDYARRTAGGTQPDDALLEHCIDTGPEMMAYLEANTPLRMYAPSTFNDYYEGDVPGGRPAGRSIDPQPYPAAELGEWAARLRTSPHLPRLTMEEGARFLRGTDLPDFAAIVAREADDIRCGGPALVAALFKGLLDRGVQVRTETAARSLIRDGDRVAGVIAESPDGEVTIRASRGVILASGGFEWNQALVDAFVGQEIFPLSPHYNEGDGLLMGLEAGAAVGNMSGFWGQPAILDPDVSFEGKPLYQMGSFRSTPGVIAVNSRGERFANEAITYQDFPKTTRTYDPQAVEYPNEGATWLIFDQSVRDHGIILPAVTPQTPTPPWVFSADTLEDLAAQIDIDGHGLAATVERWNGFVADGNDADFGRGTMRFETHMSGAFPSPKTALRAIKRGPFYAVRLYNGALGTNGGLRIDSDGRVLRARPGADGQQVIDGLYAAGNVTANVWGRAYPGGGATIGPAMVFGYCAGRHAAAHI